MATDSWSLRSEFGETNSLLKLISQQPDIDKIYLYAEDPYEATYHLQLTKRKYRIKAFKLC